MERSERKNYDNRTIRRAPVEYLTRGSISQSVRRADVLVIYVGLARFEAWVISLNAYRLSKLLNQYTSLVCRKIWFKRNGVGIVSWDIGIILEKMVIISITN